MAAAERLAGGEEVSPAAAAEMTKTSEIKMPSVFRNIDESSLEE
jgi:hypothetical protein